MADLTVSNVTKRFGDFRALRDVSLRAADGEFVAVLGPSGCGKTTLLRTIAGFERIQHGTISIGDRRLSSPSVHVPPEERRIGMVFQSYALWPHMSVSENVGYGLKIARVESAELRRRVEDALTLVGLTGYGDRSPAMLSGGQRQRVALARCLVTSPGLVLLDEPLANLDVHLRAAMEEEFSDFHKRTGTTMFYITHDQAEAMALADRIAVMDHGVIVQAATPEMLFREPATEMVAQFIGHGLIIGAEVRTKAEMGRCVARVLGVDFQVRCEASQNASASAGLCIRPGGLSIVSEGGIPARITRVTYQGGYRRVDLVADVDPRAKFVVHRPDSEAVEVGQSLQVAIDDAWIVPKKAVREEPAEDIAA